MAVTSLTVKRLDAMQIVKQVCKLKLQQTHLHARAQEKSIFFILNCLQATLITGTIMMFPASCLDTQRMGM